MPLFSRRGQSLSYERLGAGAPLILVHGWGASAGEWAEYGWTRLLGSTRQLLLPDVLGHGRSSKPHDTEAYAMKALAGDLVALLDAVGLPDADVFGYSMGGAIALWSAVLWPQRIRSLVVGAPSGSDPPGARALGQALRTNDLGDGRVRSYHEYALRSADNDPLALAACLESGLSSPACGDLARFGGPALLTAGDRDRRFEHAQHVARCLPQATFLPLDGVDHMGGFGDPRLKEAVVEFLSAPCS